MTPETRFLRLFECKILSFDFVQDDDAAFHLPLDAL